MEICYNTLQIRHISQNFNGYLFEVYHCSIKIDSKCIIDKQIRTIFSYNRNITYAGTWILKCNRKFLLFKRREVFI